MTALWRCPGCGTVQLENAECFVCRRSATSCATCANFRRSVAAGVGYCGLDRGRAPLTGSEQRPCWTSAAPAAAEGLFTLSPAGRAGQASNRRGLLDVDPSL